MNYPLVQELTMEHDCWSYPLMTNVLGMGKHEIFRKKLKESVRYRTWLGIEPRSNGPEAGIIKDINCLICYFFIEFTSIKMEVFFL